MNQEEIDFNQVINILRANATYHAVGLNEIVCGIVLIEKAKELEDEEMEAAARILLCSHLQNMYTIWRVVWEGQKPLYPFAKWIAYKYLLIYKK